MGANDGKLLEKVIAVGGRHYRYVMFEEIFLGYDKCYRIQSVWQEWSKWQWAYGVY